MQLPPVSEISVAVAVLAAGVIIAKLVDKLLVRAGMGRLPEHVLKPLRRLVAATIVAIAALAALTALHVDVSSVVVAGGFAGIVVGFASQTTVSNLISGLFLLFERPFRIGDSVVVGGHAGIVTDIKVLSTKIRRFDGTEVRIPNEKVFSSDIVTLTGNVARRISFVVGIAYKEQIAAAREVIMGVLEEDPLVLDEPGPVVYVKELADSSVNLRVKAWVPSHRYMEVRMRIVQKVKEELDRVGIEIPFPQRVVWMAHRS